MDLISHAKKLSSHSRCLRCLTYGSLKGSMAKTACLILNVRRKGGQLPCEYKAFLVQETLPNVISGLMCIILCTPC